MSSFTHFPQKLLNQSMNYIYSLLADHNNMSFFLLFSVSQPISSTTSSAYGVDWSNHAHPTSHCWFPIASNELSTAPSCAYVPCTNQESIFLRCGSCDLVVHSHHLNDSQVIKTDSLPHCRLSFVDDNVNPSKYDQHFWSHVSELPKPCMHCQRTSIATTLFVDGFDQLTTMSASDIAGQFTSMMNSTPRNFIQKLSESSSGIVCLWCAQNYHQLCWERFGTKDDHQCDYGIYR